MPSFSHVWRRFGPPEAAGSIETGGMRETARQASRLHMPMGQAGRRRHAAGKACRAVCEERARPSEDVAGKLPVPGAEEP